MRLLLDTHAFLWFVLNDPQLSAAARFHISDPANEVLVSPATCWEIAIKVALKKYALTQPFLPFMQHQMQINRFTVLPIELHHTAVVTSLLHHHKDPFDRMLVAQAMCEHLPLVSCDPEVMKYAVTCLW